MNLSRTFVLYEDRPQSVLGVKIALLSLLEHAPGSHIRVHLGGAAQRSRPWFESWGPSVEVRTEALPSGVDGWNVKPDLLLWALRDGFHRAVWIDSDVIVCGPLAERLDAAGEDLVATEDVWFGSGQRSGDRTRAWGLAVGRLLPATLNTAVLQVSSRHVGFLEAWRDLLQSAEYRDAQLKPYADRAQHMVGDQDVATALAESCEWAHLRVDLLRRGTEMAQCYGAAGFSPSERLRLGANRLPLAVHAMGPKPWLVSTSDEHVRASLWHRTHMQLTPYTSLAQRYAPQLSIELEWADHPNNVARMLRWVAREDPVLQELPMALLQGAVWRLRQTAGRSRRFVRRTIGRVRAHAAGRSAR